jgi:hypothetical protein
MFSSVPETNLTPAGVHSVAGTPTNLVYSSHASNFTWNSDHSVAIEEAQQLPITKDIPHEQTATADDTEVPDNETATTETPGRYPVDGPTTHSLVNEPPPPYIGCGDDSHYATARDTECTS